MKMFIKHSFVLLKSFIELNFFLETTIFKEIFFKTKALSSFKPDLFEIRRGQQVKDTSERGESESKEWKVRVSEDRYEEIVPCW